MNEYEETGNMQTEELVLMKGTLVKGIGGFYTVRDESLCEYTLRCKKKFRRQSISPILAASRRSS